MSLMVSVCTGMTEQCFSQPVVVPLHHVAPSHSHLLYHSDPSHVIESHYCLWSVVSCEELFVCLVLTLEVSLQFAKSCQISRC